MTKEYTRRELRLAVGRASWDLDTASPGWRDKIDLDRLNMGAGHHSLRPESLTCGCILAQLDPALSLSEDGFWETAMDSLGLSSTSAFFNTTGSSNWFGIVTDLWTREVGKRETVK